MRKRKRKSRSCWKKKKKTIQLLLLTTVERERQADVTPKKVQKASSTCSRFEAYTVVALIRDQIMGRGEGELLDLRLRSFSDQDCAFAFAEIMAVKK
jgi:hypothetical protein